MTPAEEAQIVMYGGGLLPVGGATGTAPFAQTFDRRLATGTVFAPTAGTLTMTGIWLPAGRTVTGITFVSGSTAEASGSHLWFALYDVNLNLKAQGTDETGGAAFAANSAHRQALTTPQTLSYTGLYYLGFFCSNSTVPTLCCVVASTVNLTGNITGMTPIVSATSSSGLNTGTAPNPAGSLTAVVNSLYAFVD
jgi:hypothetical protein